MTSSTGSSCGRPGARSIWLSDHVRQRAAAGSVENLNVSSRHGLRSYSCHTRATVL
jgi:hypothetical protein